MPLPPAALSGPARRVGELDIDHSDETAKVYVRVRPANQRELDLGHRPCLEVEDGRPTVTIASKPEPKTFTFDSVATEHTTQEQMFRAVGKPMIDSCLEGYNGAIFVYGQTGSGKTYTMHGGHEDQTELRGLVPRTLEYLFALLSHEERTRSDGVTFLVRCSFLEIYNEHIYDLLSPEGRSLPLREDIRRGQYVEDLMEEIVTSPSEAHSLLEIGVRNRTVGSTAMNRESSRSHSVFTLVIEQKTTRDGISNVKTSRLNLVDLAGSERQKLTDTAGAQLKEASKINKSLSVLGNVIMSLVDVANGKSRHIPYRDSKLTFLLKDSLGGNARTCIIANISPSDKCFGETLSTLKFAQRAKKIVNKAVVNEDTAGSMADLQAEILRLKSQIANMEAAPPTLGSVRQALFDHPGYQGSTADGDGDTGHGGEDQPDMGQDVQVMQSRIFELESLLLRTLNKEQGHSSEISKLTQRLCELEDLYKKKDAFSQSQKMVVKFRDSEIARLRKKTPYSVDERTESLEKEIRELKTQINLHPEVARVHIENQILQERLAELDDGSLPERLDNEEARAIELGSQVAQLIQDKHTLMEKLRTLAANSTGGASTPVKALPSSPFKSSDPLSRVVAQSIEGSPSRMSPQKRVEVESSEMARLRLKEQVDSLVEQIAEKDALVKDLESQIDRLSTDNTEAKRHATELETALKTLKVSKSVEIEQLHAQLAGSADAKDMVTALQAELDTLKGEMASTCNTLMQREATITEHTGRITDLGSEVEVISALKLELETTVAELQSEISDLKPQLKREQGVVNDYRALLEDAEARALELEQTVDKQEGEITDLSHQITAAQEERETLQETQAFAESKLAEAETQLQVSQELIASLQEQVETLKMRNDSYGKTINELKAGDKDGQLAKAHEEIKELQLMLNMADEERNEMRKSISDLENQLSEARDKLSVHEKQSESHTAAMTEMQAMVLSLRNDIKEVSADLTSAHAHADEAVSERDSYQQKVKNMESELEQMRFELETAFQDHETERQNLLAQRESDQSAWKEKYNEICVERDALKETVNIVNTELNSLATKQDEAIEMANSLRKEKSALQARIAKAHEELNDAVLKHDALQDALNTQDTAGLEASLSDALSRASTLQGENTRLQSELESSKSQIQVYRVKEDLFTQLSSQWEVTRSDKNKRISALEQEVTKLASELQTATAHSAVNVVEEEEYKKLQAESQEQRKALMASREASSLLKKENETLKAQIESLKQSLASSMSEREEWLNDIKKLRSEEKAAWDECIQLRDEIDGQTRLGKRLAKRLKESEHTIHELSAQNAKLAGHQNLKQKIQHVNHLKEENNTLIKEKVELLAQKRRMEAVIKTLQADSHKENSVPLEQLMSQANAKVLAEDKACANQEQLDKQVAHLIAHVCEVSKKISQGSNIANDSDDEDADAENVAPGDDMVSQSIKQIKSVSRHIEEICDTVTSQDRLLKERDTELMTLKKELQVMKEKSTNAIFV